MPERRPVHHNREVTAVNMDELRAIWTQDDFRGMVTAIRAVHAVDRDTTAPVIDIRTRERIA
jgi:hypothetical protein